ncbi:POU domain, class 3, transcription factor 1-A-like [Pelobates fuscus]|uniref:POU domain, class 3, transcription factor 1-A-like n=1 Tax=Pelobates fuscus TaxID=191477 RepID=UPI002FE433C6
MAMYHPLDGVYPTHRDPSGVGFQDLPTGYPNSLGDFGALEDIYFPLLNYFESPHAWYNYNSLPGSTGGPTAPLIPGPASHGKGSDCWPQFLDISYSKRPVERNDSVSDTSEEAFWDPSKEEHQPEHAASGNLEGKGHSQPLVEKTQDLSRVQTPSTDQAMTNSLVHVPSKTETMTKRNPSLDSQWTPPLTVDYESSFIAHLRNEFGKIEAKPEILTKEDLEVFAKVYRRKRSSLGHNQDNVALILGAMFDRFFSQTTMCRFENVNLSITNMCSLKPYIEKYIIASEVYPDILESIEKESTFVPKRRKPRSSFPVSLKAELEKQYTRFHTKPSPPQIAEIANLLNLPKQTVCTWFSNQRQKEKRKAKAEKKSDKRRKVENETRALEMMKSMIQEEPVLYNMFQGYNTPTMDSQLNVPTANLNMMYQPDAAICYNYSEASAKLGK